VCSSSCGAESETLVCFYTNCKLKATRYCTIDLYSIPIVCPPDEEGILLEMAGYCPEGNGIAERNNRTINEKVRSILSRACSPDELWAEAACCANYIRDRVTTRSPDVVSMSPCARRTGNSPDVHRMKNLGCMAIDITRAPQGAWEIKFSTVVMGNRVPIGNRLYVLWKGVERTDFSRDPTRW
jgi:hypothetical protein